MVPDNRAAAAGAGSCSGGRLRRAPRTGLLRLLLCARGSGPPPGAVPASTEACGTHQIPRAVWSGEVALDIGVENLNRVLREEALVEVRVVLDQRQPGLQQPVVGFHVSHVILIQLGESRATERVARVQGPPRTGAGSSPLTEDPEGHSRTRLTELA